VTAAAGAILLGAPRCAPECVHPPCPPPRAIIISVTSASGEPITSASAEVTGTANAIPCQAGSLSNMCIVFGNAGTYQVRVTAPGFQSVTASVVVASSTPACGCGTVDTRIVTIALPAA
jgi:hypothetical protein